MYGSHADYLCVPAGWLVPVPDGLDPAEAAIVVFNYMTAYQMLHRTAQSDSLSHPPFSLGHSHASGRAIMIMPRL